MFDIFSRNLFTKCQILWDKIIFLISRRSQPLGSFSPRFSSVYTEVALAPLHFYSISLARMSLAKFFSLIVNLFDTLMMFNSVFILLAFDEIRCGFSSNNGSFQRINRFSTGGRLLNTALVSHQWFTWFLKSTMTEYWVLKADNRKS